MRKIGKVGVPTEPFRSDKRVTGFTFMSYDKNADFLRFEIKDQDGSPTDLEGATVRLFMRIYQRGEEREFPVFDSQVITESAAEGIVNYQIPNMLLSYEGRVDANVYIDFPDGSHTDNLAFTFNVERSAIDGEIQTNGNYYFTDFQQLLEGVQQEAQQSIDTITKDLEGSLDEFSQSVAAMQEDLTETEDRIEQIDQQINDIGKLTHMYSNNLDFGAYDYSGNPNLAPNLKYSDARASGNATIEDNGTSLSYTSEVGATGTVLLPFTPYLPNKTYTLTIKVRLDETSIPSFSSFIGVSYSIPSSGAPLYTNIIRTTNMELGVEKTYTHTVTTGDIVDANGWALRLYTAGGDLIKFDLSYEVKLEKSETSTHYQPNLLGQPWQISKTSVKNNLGNKSVSFPITSASPTVYSANMIEPYTIGQEYTIRIRANKPTANSLRAFNSSSSSTYQLGIFQPVEGLINVYEVKFTATSTNISKNHPSLLQIIQYPLATPGSVTLEWLKIEKGSNATPNISQHKYFGEGLRDSNNPNDYSWNITPEYAEKSLNNTVSLTEPQSIEGLKNFEDGIQSKGKSVLTSDDMKTAVYTLTMSDVPDSTITELTGELVRVNNYVTLRCRVNAPVGTKVVFRVREGYRENIEDVWEIPLTAISQADHKNQVAYYALTEANKREIRLVTVTAGNHFITGSWRTDDLWPTL